MSSRRTTARARDVSGVVDAAVDVARHDGVDVAVPGEDVHLGPGPTSPPPQAADQRPKQHEQPSPAQPRSSDEARTAYTNYRRVRIRRCAGVIAPASRWTAAKLACDNTCANRQLSPPATTAGVSSSTAHDRRRRRLRLAIPNGNLQQATVDLFCKAGYNMTRLRRAPTIPSVDDDEIECMLVRPQEQPRYVQDGLIDAGFTGLDLHPRGRRRRRRGAGDGLLEGLAASSRAGCSVVPERFAGPRGARPRRQAHRHGAGQPDARLPRSSAASAPWSSTPTARPR